MSAILERSVFKPNPAEGYPAWIDNARGAAWSDFVRLGIPTTKNEEWKYTSLRELTETAFLPPSRPDLNEDVIAPFTVGLENAVRIVFVNGFYCPELSSALRNVDGLEVRTLRCKGGDLDTQFEKQFGRLVKTDSFAFGALNTASFEDGAYIHFTKNGDIERPVQVLFLSTGGVATFPRLFIHAEEGSKGSIVETYGTLDAGANFTCAVVEAYIESNTNIELIKAQLENEATFHIALQEAKVERDGMYLTYNVTLGGHLTRNDVNVYLNGENCHVRMDGAYILDGNQICDNHTRLDHAMPHCDSFEVYKGVLDGNATGVFNGKIFVYEDAQKTDAKQTNQALLLSPTATINTKPQLEIFADDVKCTHGATIGQLRGDAMFYLRSRGIPEVEARALLVYAFAAEVIEKISIEPLRAELKRQMFEKLGVGKS